MQNEGIERDVRLHGLLSEKSAAIALRNRIRHFQDNPQPRGAQPDRTASNHVAEYDNLEELANRSQVAQS